MIKQPAANNKACKATALRAAYFHMAQMGRKRKDSIAARQIAMMVTEMRLLTGYNSLVVIPAANGISILKKGSSFMMPGPDCSIIKCNFRSEGHQNVRCCIITKMSWKKTYIDSAFDFLFCACSSFE
jgi:hypothetical protein